MAGEKTFTFNLSEEIDRFLTDSSLSTGQPEPRCVLLMGGVATGKTTIRKSQYSQGYVVLDAGEIFLKLCRGEYYAFGEAFEESVDVIGGHVACRAIAERRNIVTELIGGDYDQAASVIEAMKAEGYKVEVVAVHCDIETAVQRNLNRGPDSISAYFTEPYHIRWITHAAARISSDCGGER
ncbi:MAG TPA: zeta toxin family protein [Blastocatellia bacterium]|nr:zeta toxin family protein [Blastocatellia bacterium]